MQHTPLDFAHDQLGHGRYAVDLDGEVHSFHDSVRDALVARGVLYRDGDGVWRLTWHGFDLEREKAGWLALCDFCSARPVTWDIPCEQFDLPPVSGAPRLVSVGHWAACETCGTLIDQRKKMQFLEHCLRAREPRRLLAPAQRQLHARFWRHYSGGAHRVEPHPFGH